MGFNENIANIRAGIAEAARAAGRDPADVTLLAATKTRTSGEIRAAIAAGITACGENRVQELTAHLADDAYRGASVHFIGHLQTNKVKYVVGKVSLIHSVSSEKLLRAVAARRTSWGWSRTSCWRSIWRGRSPSPASPRHRPWTPPGWPASWRASASGG